LHLLLCEVFNMSCPYVELLGVINKVLDHEEAANVTADTRRLLW